MKIVDLFSGLGGLTIGAIEASKIINSNLSIEFACDIDKSCSEFYTHNYSRYLKEFYMGSVVDRGRNAVRSGSVDYLFAGPPCQGHSDLNNSTRRSDPRNLLYLETIRLIGFYNPSTFIIENVPGVVHASERVVAEVKKHLSPLYNIHEYVVDFLRLGVPQTRKRHILIGSKLPLDQQFFDSIYEKYRECNLRDAIYDLRAVPEDNLFNTPSRMSKKNSERAKYMVDNHLFDLPNSLRPPCHQREHSYKSMYGRLDWDLPSQTITSGFGSMGQGRFLHPDGQRVITPHEAARIQGLPDWLDFSNVIRRGELHKMIGNVVPPKLSEEIILKMEGIK